NTVGYLALDQFGIQKLFGATMDEERVTTLVQLLEKRYEDQIILSHDSINHWLGRHPDMDEDTAYLVRNWHPSHLFENIVPELKERGIQEEVIEKLFHLSGTTA